jgi:ribosome biogenesis GTPase / thiamine phosphate phosphatase
MSRKSKKNSREKDITAKYLSGEMDEDTMDSRTRYSEKSGDSAQKIKMQRTTDLRNAEEENKDDSDRLPIGQVTQFHSLYQEVLPEDGSPSRLCVIRKTFLKLLKSPIVVGDRVRFRDTPDVGTSSRQIAVIESVLPRTTVLLRAYSFKAIDAQSIVANATQMLIVLAIQNPNPKWGLVDRMIVAAKSGGLVPIVCLNKVDLIDPHFADDDVEFGLGVMAHYEKIGIRCLRTSVMIGEGLVELKAILKDQKTVLAGHSGVGKSSLIHSVSPLLDVRIGAISGYTGKGMHTTTSARRYELEPGTDVIDTPGVKLFGLWSVSKDNLPEYFPDVANETAPDWRVESYRRIEESL